MTFVFFVVVILSAQVRIPGIRMSEAKACAYGAEKADETDDWSLSRIAGHVGCVLVGASVGNCEYSPSAPIQQATDARHKG